MVALRFFQKHFKRFKSDESGNFVMLGGFLLVVVVFTAGMGIDHMRALNEKSTLQKALDASALAGASVSLNDPQNAEDAAIQAFNLNYQAESGIDNGSVDFNFERNGRAITVTAESQVRTLLSSVFGREFIDVNADATAQGGIERVEFVLAVDQSSSMRGARQVELLAALEDFRNTVYSTDEDGNLLDQSEIFVGMIPWQATVNTTPRLGVNWTFDLAGSAGVNFSQESPSSPGNLLFNEDTLTEDVQAALTNHNFTAHGFSGFEGNTTEGDFAELLGNDIDPEDYPDLSWRGCLMARDIGSAVPYQPSQNVEDFAPSVTNRSDLAADISVLDRPIGDRRFHVMYQPPGWGVRNHDNDWTPFGSARQQDTQIPNNENLRTPNMACTTYETTYLTDTAADVGVAIDNLEVEPRDDVQSNTDSSLGMIWALRMLDPKWAEDWGADFTPADFNDPVSRKVIILLTDGENAIDGLNNSTETRSWTPYGRTRDTLHANVNSFNRSTEPLDIRTLRFCELARELGVEVYTIAFDVTSGPEEMLKNCATEANAPFFQSVSSDDGGELSEVFRAIAQQATTVVLTN